MDNELFSEVDVFDTFLASLQYTIEVIKNYMYIYIHYRRGAESNSLK